MGPASALLSTSPACTCAWRLSAGLVHSSLLEGLPFSTNVRVSLVVLYSPVAQHVRPTRSLQLLNSLRVSYGHVEGYTTSSCTL